MKKQFTVKEFGSDHKKVVFFFAGMGTRTWLYMKPIKLLVKNGYHVIAYDFDPLVVRNGDADNFLRLAKEVSRSVKSYIKICRAAEAKEFTTFGVSMGTLTAIKCAAENKEIAKVIINMTYGSVAENVWTWWFIRPAKKRAIAQGYTMESLDAKLAPVSPIPNAPKLKGKHVLLYLSSKDKILPFEQSRQFKEALEEHEMDFRYIQNDKHGHIITGYKNLKNSSVYLDFLADKAT